MNDQSHTVKGHLWNGTNVLVVYEDSSGKQYYQHPTTGLPIYRQNGSHLADGSSWHDTGRWVCTFPTTAFRKGIHEAGHAALAILEEIALEYITIEPYEDQGQRYDGMCQWDYGVVAKRKSLEHDEHSFCEWLEKEAKFYVGGIVAECRHLRECGQTEEPTRRYSWTGDLENLDFRVRHRSDHLGLHYDEDRLRILREVTGFVQQQRVWDGIGRIARELTLYEAIPGSRAEELFQE